MSLLSDIEKKARQNHARIGLGIGKISEKLIKSAQDASDYADVVLVGDEKEIKAIGTNLEIIHSDDATKKLVELLLSGKIDGAVRGTLSATKTLSELKRLLIIFWFSQTMNTGLFWRLRRLTLN